MKAAAQPNNSDADQPLKRYRGKYVFLDDLEKMGRLFKKKGIKTTVFEMLSIFFEIIREKAKKEQNMPEHKLDKLLDKDREFISNFLFRNYCL